MSNTETRAVVVFFGLVFVTGFALAIRPRPEEKVVAVAVSQEAKATSEITAPVVKDAAVALPPPATLPPSEAPAKPITKPERSLAASVSRSQDGLRIANGDLFDWSAVRVSINPTFLSYGYTITVRTVKAGDSVFIPFNEFADGDHNRFSSKRTKLGEVRITATIAGEHGGALFEPKSSVSD